MVLVCIARIDCIVSTASEFSLEPRIFLFPATSEMVG